MRPSHSSTACSSSVDSADRRRRSGPPGRSASCRRRPAHPFRGASSRSPVREAQPVLNLGGPTADTGEMGVRTSTVVAAAVLVLASSTIAVAAISTIDGPATVDGVCRTRRERLGGRSRFLAGRGTTGGHVAS